MFLHLKYVLPLVFLFFLFVFFTIRARRLTGPNYTTGCKPKLFVSHDRAARHMLPIIFFRRHFEASQKKHMICVAHTAQTLRWWPFMRPNKVQRTWNKTLKIQFSIMPRLMSSTSVKVVASWRRFMVMVSGLNITHSVIITRYNTFFFLFYVILIKLIGYLISKDIWWPISSNRHL